MSGPEKIWAWRLNSPYGKYHKLRMWAPHFPIFKPSTVTVFEDSPWWKLWGMKSQQEPVALELTEYTRTDLIDPHPIARAALEAAAKACESAAYDGTYSSDDMVELGCLRSRDYIRALANDDAALAEIVKGVKG